MPLAIPILFGAALATGTAKTIIGISRAGSAAKKAKGQSEQFDRVRAEERKKAETLAKRAEGLEAAAESKAATEAKRRTRKRSTLATGPRGLLDEPTTKKPSLLGA